MKKLILAALLLLFPITSYAKIYIVIDEASSKKFPIAVPEFLTAGGGQNETTRQLTSLLKKDLEIAGLFKVMDERNFIAKDTDTENIDFTKWTAIEAMALVKGMVTSDGGKVTAEIRLFDTQTQKLLVGKQYSFPKKDYAQAIHRFVDELMNTLTGERGPFSSRIAAACGRPGQRQISTFSIDGVVTGGITRNKSNNISPSWAPDAKSLVFTSFLKYYPEIFAANSDGSSVVQLTNLRSTTITPVVSPSGSEIIFASAKSGDTELYSMSRSGRMGSKLTQVFNIDVSPAFSPDGSQIVFASERAGNLHLFSMPASGGGANRLTYTGYQNDQPDWSPNGQKIVFTARDRGAFDIFLMNSDGSLIQRLTRDEGNNESPSWSPDSRYIAFSRGMQGIYIMLADGNNQTLIPNTAGCINPDWSNWIR